MRRIVVRDLVTNLTRLASAPALGPIALGDAHAGSPGVADGPSGAPAISTDGRFIAFHSDATNLTPGDTNGVSDVFLFDLASGATALLSVNTLGQVGDGNSLNPDLNDDGSFVAFESDATNLVPGDLNGSRDVFGYSRADGSLGRVTAPMDDAPAKNPTGYGMVAVRGGGGGEDPTYLGTAVGETHSGFNGGNIFTGSACALRPVCDMPMGDVVDAPVGETVSVPLRGTSPCSGERLTFTLLSALPSGATLSPPMPFTGLAGEPVESTLVWTPTLAQRGDYDVDFMVTDSRGRASTCTLLVRVGGCPPPPFCTINPPGPFTIAAGQTLTFSVTGQIECPDNIVTLSLTTPLPSGATLTPPLPLNGAPNQPVTTTFSWRPRLNQLGMVTVGFQVQDLTGGLSNCSAQINVVPPSCLDDPECSFSQTSPVQTVPGGQVQFTLTGTRCPGEPVTVAALALPDGAITNPSLPFTFAPAAAATVLVTWTPTAEDQGVFPFTFRVTDSLDRTSQCSLSVNVNPCAAAPLCVGLPEGPFNILVDQKLTFQVLASTGCPGASLTLVAEALPPGATTTPPLPIAGGADQDLATTFSWTPTVSQLGDFTARFRVTDNTGRTSTCSFAMRVELCDRAPTLTIVPPGPFVVAAGDLVAFLVTGATDCPATGLMLSSGPTPPGSTLTPPLPTIAPPGFDAVSHFGWIPTESDVGDYTVGFTVLDSNGRSATGSVEIRVLVPCREEEVNDTLQQANLIDADCVYFDGKLEKFDAITCEPDTFLVLFNKDGQIINRDDNGSNKGNGWASGLFGLKRYNKSSPRPPGNGGDGIVSNDDGTFSVRVGVTGRADGLDGNLNGYFQNAPHGQRGPFRLEVAARNAAGALLSPAVLPGGEIVANPMVYTDEFLTGAEAFRINYTLPIGAITIDVCLDNSLGSAPVCKDIDFFTIFNMVPLCDYCITQVAGLDCECRPTDTLVGWFDKLGDLIAFSDDGGPIEGYAELCLVADVNGRAHIAVTGTGDENFDGLADAGSPGRAPAECPEPPPGHGVCGCYTFCIMVLDPHGASQSDAPAPGRPAPPESAWRGDLNLDGAIDTIDLGRLLGLMEGSAAR